MVVSHIFGIFIPILGEDEPILKVAYFSNWLVQPPTLWSYPQIGRLALESWHERLVADGEILTRDHSVTGETLGFF